MVTHVPNITSSITKALTWLSLNQHEFNIEHAKTPEQRLKLLKPVGELVLIAGLANPVQMARKWCLRQLEFAWETLEQGNEILRILITRPDLIIASTVYASFKGHGFENKKLEQYIKFLSETETCRSIEFPRWRKLDLFHALSKLGIQEFPQAAHVGTWLENEPEPWTLTDDIAYAVTHEVFYITDFGAEPHRLPSNIRNYLVRWLPVWIDLYHSRDNMDIVAELLGVGACIGATNLFDFEMQRLLALQNPDGSFPGPGVVKRDASDRQIFLHDYHTTLVSLMACCLFEIHRDLQKQA